MKRKIIIESICFLFIFLFIYAAVSKLLDLEKFRVQVGQSPMLAKIAGLIVWLVPAIELVVSVVLAIPKLRLWGLYVSFTLMIMFTSYVFAIMNFSDQVPCSCGGILEKLGWTGHLIFNSVFVLLALVGIVFNINETSGSEANRYPAKVK